MMEKKPRELQWHDLWWLYAALFVTSMAHLSRVWPGVAMLMMWIVAMVLMIMNYQKQQREQKKGD